MSSAVEDRTAVPVQAPSATNPDVVEAKPAAGLDKDSPLGQLAAKLGSLLDRTGHDEIYGVKLTRWQEGTDLEVPQQVILQKFIRANSGDVTKATEQLEGALRWRKEFNPLKAKDEFFDKARFDGLGYVVKLKGVPGSPSDTDAAVFNIYGAVKDNKKTFGDLDGFVRWRVALMELTLAQLDLPNAKIPLPDFGKGPDPYQAVQVHDYLSVSFLRQAPEVKASSAKTIQLFQANYPETMSKKYFVNVPIFMQWMFSAMSVFMAKETIAKMKWMSYGTELYKDLGSSVPKAYGGSGPSLTDVGITPKYHDGTTGAPAPDPIKAESTVPASDAEGSETAPSHEAQKQSDAAA